VIAVIDRILATLAWACQVGAAVLYLAVTFQSDVWRDNFSKSPMPSLSAWGFSVGMTLLWMTALREEQIHLYNRRTRTAQRKTRIIGHSSVLFIASVSAIDQKDRIGMWALMVMCVVLSTGTWNAWMKTRMLPAEDQAVIDAIHDREAQQAAAAFDASEKEQRRQRLSAIVSSLGYELTETQTSAVQPADTNHARWAVPSGKHAPLVYFIRNGNRIKIGTSTELKRRIRTLALRAENVALLLDGDRRLERQLHNQFADLRIGDTEWFAYEAPLTDYIADQNRHARKEQAK
jgi:hypothetical protein